MASGTYSFRLSRIEASTGGESLAANRALILDNARAGARLAVGAVGLAAALEYLEAVGADAVERHEKELVAHAEPALRAVPGLRLLGAVGRGALLALGTEAWALRAGSRLLRRVDLRVPTQQ